MNRKTIAIIVLGIVLLASLLVCGYFGMKTFRRTRLRRAGMEAYEKKDYTTAERLLLQYISKDPNAEKEFAALANIYHEFGNTGMEAQMWQSASALNPLNAEYREKVLTSAMQSANYNLLHSILGRKSKAGEVIIDQELYLYVISSLRAGYPKDGNEAYQKAVKADKEAFHKNDLGRLAEFMVNYSNLSEGEREDYLSKAMQSEDPVIRFEAVLYSIRRIRMQANGESDQAEEIEAMLKQAVGINYYAGTIYLADYYYSRTRFQDVISILEPYLKTIDDPKLYLLYIESCFYEKRLDELKDLEKKLRRKPGSLPVLAEYCEILIANMENDEEKLIAAVRKSGNIIVSPLSRFIRLRVAMLNGAHSEIKAVVQEIFSAPPFFDVQTRVMLICLDYITNEMKKPENQNDPSQMADLASILAARLENSNQMLTEIILMDQYKKGLAREEDLLAALQQFPDDVIIQQLAIEYLVFNEKPELASSIIEKIMSSAEDGENQEIDSRIIFMQMLTLDQLGKRDEASAIFRKLVEQSEFDLELLNQYFQFCVEYGRAEDMKAMADKLDTVKDGKLEHFGKFFRAAALFAEVDANSPEEENEEETQEDPKEKEALELLASTPTGDPEFTFYAANRLCDYDRLDEAEAKYKAILKTYRLPPLIHINLSELYQAKGDATQALEEAKTAFDMEKSSMLPAFIYATRLSEAGRYQEAVDVLKFPRHAVNYREDVVELWVDCMRHAIENSMEAQKYLQAEDQLKHLLVIVPDDEFGKENLEKVRKLIKSPKKEDKPGDMASAPAPAA